MASLIDRLTTTNEVNSIVISPDGERIGVACESEIIVWNAHTGQNIYDSIKGHSSSVWSLAFSMDGRVLASGSEDGTIRMWDAETGKAVMEPFEGHADSVNSVTFSYHDCLVSGSDDCTIRMWETRTGQPAGETIHTGSRVSSVAVSHDGMNIASASHDKTIKVYDANTGTVLFQCIGHRDSVNSIAFSPSGRHIVSASKDHTLRIWHGTTGAAIGKPLEGHTSIVLSVAFSPDGKCIASGSKDGTVRLWHSMTGTLQSDQLSGHGEWVTAVTFTPYDNRLISGSLDGAINIWDVRPLAQSTNTPIQSMSMETEELQTEITSTMTPEAIVVQLGIRGCENLTDKLDLSSCSDYPISSGGYGDIYRGNLIDRTEVAIKTIRLYTGSSGHNQKNLKHAAREIYNWSRCRHYNVQRLLGLVIFRSMIAMVTRWESNGSLPGYLAKHPEADRCDMSTQIAAGLAYLHVCGVIHGDLKAANVLVSDGGVPELADFGNSMLQESTLKFTENSTTAGFSVRWAAPEVLKGARCSVLADVYALGMTILETITGTVPWSGKLEHAVMMAVMLEKAHPKRPLEYIPENSKQGNILWLLLQDCWKFESVERPTAEDVRRRMRMITKDGLTPLI